MDSPPLPSNGTTTVGTGDSAADANSSNKQAKGGDGNEATLLNSSTTVVSSSSSAFRSSSSASSSLLRTGNAAYDQGSVPFSPETYILTL